jgi:hypothetical protein
MGKKGKNTRLNGLKSALKDQLEEKHASDLVFVLLPFMSSFYCPEQHYPDAMLL